MAAFAEDGRVTKSLTTRCKPTKIRPHWIGVQLPDAAPKLGATVLSATQPKRLGARKGGSAPRCGSSTWDGGVLCKPKSFSTARNTLAQRTCRKKCGRLINRPWRT